MQLHSEIHFAYTTRAGATIYGAIIQRQVDMRARYTRAGPVKLRPSPLLYFPCRPSLCPPSVHNL